MNLLNRFTATVKSERLYDFADQLILAVSGGVDSVVLCELCHQAGYAFSIAHCNFQLRGEESERDEKLVRQLGVKYGVEVMVKKFETGACAAELKISIQEAARMLRYEWFSELVDNRQFNAHSLPTKQTTQKTVLLTAHHADDNNETLLMHFFRGTGLHGLTAIPAKYGDIRRPLLGFFKEELLDFSRENKLDYVEDSSNESSKYTRNFFRNEILPMVSQVYPQVKYNLQDNINRFKEAEKLYRLSVDELKKKLCRIKGAEVHIPVKQLLQYNNRALIYEIIRDYGFGEKQVEEVLKLAGSVSGRYLDAPAMHYRMIKHRHWFIISPVFSAASALIAIGEQEKYTGYEQGILSIEKIMNTGKQVPAETDTAWLDTKLIRYPLVLRKWKAGDYFYPLGMKKKKKLSRFFIDLRLSKSQKENCWVLETDKRIAWVIGYRIDDRFKITAHTKEILALRSES